MTGLAGGPAASVRPVLTLPAPSGAPPWARARAVARCALPTPAERVGIADSDGRVLAADVAALVPLPSFDTSAMDGWAVSGPGPWRVQGEVLAGAPPGLHLVPGGACLIATGAAVPPGATAVVREEEGILVGDRLTAEHLVGRDIRPVGEEVGAGEVLARAGATLGPALLGLLSAAGWDRVEVRAVPRVALLLFGDELVDHGVPDVGQVRDSLGPQLPGWIRRLGGRVTRARQVGDTLDAHVAAIDDARRGVDLVVTTGGTASGRTDHPHAAVAMLGGTFLVDAVAVRPGHPMGLAALPPGGGTPWLLTLPGNPHSAIVSLLTLGIPLLDSMLGRPARPLPTVRIATAVPAPAQETRLVAATLAGGVGHPVRHQGAAMLRGLATADGFAVVPPGGAEPLDEVEWLALPPSAPSPPAP